MRIQKVSASLLVALFLCFQTSKAETISGNFEILDLSGPISGDPQLASDAARSSWQKACLDWKNEIKELNKKNEMIAISCETPSCSLTDSAKTQCTSTGTYKIKTAGSQVTPSTPTSTTPPVSVTASEPEVISAPPQVIVETVPAPRLGFIWIPGFWGWQAHHHHWVPGHWTEDRPGHYWIRERWSQHRHGWRFEPGHWASRHF